MRKRPFLLFLSSSLFLYFPIELAQKAYAGHHLNWLDFVLSGVLPLVCMVSLMRVTKFGWFALVAFVSIWGMRDLWAYYEETGATMRYFMHVVIYLFSISYFINPRIRHVYFDPKLRWWRIKPRFETHMPFMLSRNGEWDYPVLRNISEGGCFIETPHLGSLQETVQLTVPLPVPLGVSVIKASGEIRWISRNPLRYGMGVQFKEPLPEHAKAIKEFVRQQL